MATTSGKVAHGKVVQVGEGLAPPTGARVWDCTGKVIHAGFVEPFLGEVEAQNEAALSRAPLCDSVLAAEDFILPPGSPFPPECVSVPASSSLDTILALQLSTAWAGESPLPFDVRLCAGSSESR